MLNTEGEILNNMTLLSFNMSEADMWPKDYHKPQRITEKGFSRETREAFMEE